MPYEIVHDPSAGKKPYKVRKKGGGKTFGHHPTREHAKRQIAALHANVRESWEPGLLADAVEVGKPGTNFTQVSPEHRKKIQPIVRHYMGKPHPFGACVRDNTKRFGPERAKRICAVVKDMGEGTTKWRKGRMREERLADELWTVGTKAGLTEADFEAWAEAVGDL